MLKQDLIKPLLKPRTNIALMAGEGIDMMELERLQEFFLWCMIINTGIYAFTAIAVFAFRGSICWIHEKIFGFDEKTTLESVHRYLASYKLFITAFNFTPWLTILIVK